MNRYIYIVWHTWIDGLSDNRGHRLARCRLIRIPVKSRYAERGVSDMHVTSAKRYEIWLLCSRITFAWLKIIDEIHTNAVSMADSQRFEFNDMSDFITRARYPKLIAYQSLSRRLIARISVKIEIRENTLISVDLR